MILDFIDRLAYFDSYRLELSHKQLLKATVLKEQVMLTAWQDWCDSVDIETLDSSCYSLLPRLYQNLLDHGVDDTHIARLKGIYRRNWYANQLRIKSLQAILLSLKSIGIEAIVLGNAAGGGVDTKIENYRPISSFHILLDANSLETAIQHLLALNWQRVDGNTQHFMELRHHSDSSLNLPLYLQGHLFWAIPQDYTDGQVWHYATADWSSEVGWRPSPTDQFLDECARMFFRQLSPKLSRLPKIHQIADAFLLIQNQGNNFDWIRLITQAQRYQMILPVRNMLRLLQQLFVMELPTWVLPTLWQMPIANAEWVKYRVLSGDRRALMRSSIVRSLQLLTVSK